MSSSGKLKLSDVDSLQQLRDELTLQAHLMKAEAKDRWAELEQDWARLQDELRPVRSAANKSAGEISAAAQLLVESLKDGYQQMKRSVKP
jgi:hypothetical protein